MPGQRLPMRKIRDVLRLNADGMSKRKIAISLGIGATAAGDCIRRARGAGLAWLLGVEADRRARPGEGRADRRRAERGQGAADKGQAGALFIACPSPPSGKAKEVNKYSITTATLWRYSDKTPNLSASNGYIMALQNKNIEEPV